MQEPPKGWPRMVSSIFYDDAAAAIDWLVRAFGFEVQLKIEGEGGRIEYSQLVYGGGQVTIGQADPSRPGRAFAASPRSAGGHNTQAVCVCVDDADAMCARARAAGGVISVEPTTIDYGDDYWSDRTCEVIDPEGHHWWFMQRLRDKDTGGA
jgi:uncharacterized glyoxalase superfamily protein PhnB